MSTQFHELSVADITRETPDSVCVAFDVPEALREAFRYKPGQHLTLRTTIGGEDVRRSYSICSGLSEGRLRVGIKKVPGGVFSAFANDNLAAGDVIQVMAPQGRFAVDVSENAANNYLMIAAGSGNHARAVDHPLDAGGRADERGDAGLRQPRDGLGSCSARNWKT